MFKKTLMMSALAGALLFSNGFVLAADQDRTRLQDQDPTKDQIKDQTKDQDRDRTQDKIQDRTQDKVFGSQLMTKQERNEYRSKMRAAKTTQEREQIRAEHHERMQVRAKERGVTLPDEPPARGSGMGAGAGGGMGPGGAGGGMGGGGMGAGGKR